MTSAPLLSLGLLTCLCVGAVPSAVAAPSINGPTAEHAIAADAASAAPAALDASERDALLAAQASSADLGELKAGFAMDDEDVAMGIGAVAVVVLLVLLL